jgi:hypothetical protein
MDNHRDYINQFFAGRCDEKYNRIKPPQTILDGGGSSNMTRELVPGDEIKVRSKFQ